MINNGVNTKIGVVINIHLHKLYSQSPITLSKLTHNNVDASQKLWTKTMILSVFFKVCKSAFLWLTQK